MHEVIKQIKQLATEIYDLAGGKKAEDFYASLKPEDFFPDEDFHWRDCSKKILSIIEEYEKQKQIKDCKYGCNNGWIKIDTTSGLGENDCTGFPAFKKCPEHGNDIFQMRSMTPEERIQHREFLKRMTISEPKPSEAPTEAELMGLLKSIDGYFVDHDDQSELHKLLQKYLYEKPYLYQEPPELIHANCDYTARYGSFCNKCGKIIKEGTVAGPNAMIERLKVEKIVRAAEDLVKNNPIEDLRRELIDFRKDHKRD